MSPVILAIVVVAGETPGAVTEAMRSAAADVLGSAHVKVREVDDVSDDTVLSVERELGARAVASVAWSDREHLEARVRLHLADSGRWSERPLEFETADDLVERGRALGFAVASMLPEAKASADDAATARAAPEPTAAAPPAWPPHGAASLRVIGSLGVGGPAAGGGAGGDLDLFVMRRLSLRLGGGMRNGTASLLPGSRFSAYVAAGVAWWALVPQRESGLAVAMRAEARALHDDLTITIGEGARSERSSRWLPGAAAAVELSWVLGRYLALVGALGAEFAFGVTDVYVVEGTSEARTLKGTIPALRAIAEAGVRIQF